MKNNEIYFYMSCILSNQILTLATKPKFFKPSFQLKNTTNLQCFQLYFVFIRITQIFEFYIALVSFYSFYSF